MSLGDPFGEILATRARQQEQGESFIMKGLEGIAERKQQEREMQQKYGMELGLEKEKGKIKKEIELETGKDKLKQATAFIRVLQGGDTLGGAEKKSGIGITGYDLDPISGDLKVKFGQTPETEVQQQAQTAKAKEREIAISKAERLQVVGESAKKQWLKTSPYGGAITRTGLVPVLGQWDILKKGIGATSAQRQDQVYSDFVQGIRAQLARGMGDVGNLSEYEQRAVIRLIPNLYDSYETGMLKLGQLGQLVEDIKATRGKSTSQELQEPTATNPKTGEKMIYRGGKWQSQ